MKANIQPLVRALGYCALIALVFSCARDPGVDMDQVLLENQELKKKVAAQDSIVTRIGVGAKFVNAYLDSLDQLEAAVKRDLASHANDSVIIGKVKSITSLVNLNRAIVEELRRSLGEDNLAAKMLLDHVVRLDEKVKSQEMKIAVLNRDLAEIGAELRDVLGTYAELETQYQLQSEGLSKYKTQVKTLETELSKKEEELVARETKLNTAYYFFGDKKELQSLNIIKKANLLTYVLNENINLAQLNKVDIREFTSLAIPTPAIKIISDHPAGSYRTIPVNSGTTITITDAAAFWSITKTLIIQTD